MRSVPQQTMMSAALRPRHTARSQRLGAACSASALRACAFSARPASLTHRRSRGAGLVLAAGDGDSASAEPPLEEVGVDEVDTLPPSPVERLKALAQSGADGDTLAALAADLEAALSAANDRAAGAMSSVADLETAVKTGKDQLLRLNAEYQNFRNRTEREKSEIGDRVKGQVLEELIPIIDNFEAAKQYIKPESDGEKKIESSYQQLYKQMVETFKKMGIEAVPTVGKPFDPAVHEAIARQPSADVTEDTVVTEFRKGFRVGGRLIRPATVAVAVPLEGGAETAGGAAAGEEASEAQAQ